MRFVVGLLLGAIIASAAPSSATSDSPDKRMDALCHVVQLDKHARLTKLHIACPDLADGPQATPVPLPS